MSLVKMGATSPLGCRPMLPSLDVVTIGKFQLGVHALGASWLYQPAGSFTCEPYCRDKFGWAPNKVDELLSPVLKAYEQRSSQLTMDQFLSFNQRFAKIRSKRLQKAVTAITGGALDPEM